MPGVAVLYVFGRNRYGSIDGQATRIVIVGGLTLLHCLILDRRAGLGVFIVGVVIK